VRAAGKSARIFSNQKRIHTKMKQGIVKWFRGDKGYGFLTGDDEVETFVHWGAIINSKPGRFKTLIDGQRVQYEIVETDRGPAAQNVSILAQF
jgi:CspA family cold shock protein